MNEPHLTYTQIGDYFYPDLALPEENERLPLGKYGVLRKSYLRQHQPMLYDRLLLVGKLDAHLREIDDMAHERVQRMVRDMAKAEGVDEALKARDQMRWVGLMNNFRSAAEEQVLEELVYTR